MRGKTKGVADIVFMVDVSGSMAPCIDALRAQHRGLRRFAQPRRREQRRSREGLARPRSSAIATIEAAESEGLPWIVDNPFVRDAAAP